MRIIQGQSKAEAVEVTALIILEKILAHPGCTIGLATGKTMEPLYKEFVKIVKDTGTISAVEKSFFFMLDEYKGFSDGHPSTFKHYIKKHFLGPLNLPETQIAFPPAHLENGDKIYEELIREKGGIDLQLLGIGKNGHVGFNEPGSEKDSRTRFVTLTNETLEANKDQFTDVVPAEALSMGIGTILEAKSLLMLATGKSKADTIKYVLNHHDDPSCPATFLKTHPHFTLVLDPDAESNINLNI